MTTMNTVHSISEFILITSPIITIIAGVIIAILNENMRQPKAILMMLALAAAVEVLMLMAMVTTMPTP